MESWNDLRKPSEQLFCQKREKACQYLGHFRITRLSFGRPFAPETGFAGRKSIPGSALKFLLFRYDAGIGVY